MAFVGAISDLFSCGRARRPQTRDETRDAADTNTGEEAARADPLPDIRIDATLSDNADKTPSRPSDANAQTFLGDGLSHTDPLDHRESIEGRPSTVRPSTDAVRSLQYVPEEVPQSRTRRIESIGEKPKTGSGWQVEKQFLVTTNTLDASSAAPKLSLDKVEASVIDITPVVTTQDPVPAPLVETTNSKVEDVEEAVVHEAVTDTKLDEDHPFLPEPVCLPQSGDTAVSEAASMPQSQESEAINSDPIVSKEVAVEIQLPQIAPVQFLDLPTEIRNLIYEKMTEEGPIRMCRHDDPALARADNEQPRIPKRQFYNLTQVCRQLRTEFLPVYEQHTEYVIDLWTQRANLVDISSLKGQVAMDIDAACFDMQPIDLLPLIRYIARTRRTSCQFASTEGVVFRSIEAIVEQLNKLLPSTSSKESWLAAINGPMKRIDLHLFPHEDIRQYYRFRGAEPMMRIVYPSAATEAWMKQSHKSGGEYQAYLEKTGLDALEMHVVVGHASWRTTNEGRLPLDWRLSYAGSRLSVEQAVRISGQWTR